MTKEQFLLRYSPNKGGTTCPYSTHLYSLDSLSLSTYYFPHKYNLEALCRLQDIFLGYNASKYIIFCELFPLFGLHTIVEWVQYDSFELCIVRFNFSLIFLISSAAIDFNSALISFMRRKNEGIEDFLYMF